MLLEHKLKNTLRAGVPPREWQSWEEDLGLALEKKKDGGQSSMGLV